MASSLVSKVIDFLDDIERHSDPRVHDWFMMSSAMSPILVILLYLLFVLKIGPHFMKHRSPLQLKYPMIVYNAAQVILSVYLVEEALRLMWLPGDYSSFNCIEVNFDNTPKEVQKARTVWLFFITKMMDLLDTVFFVLRKKDRQLTFLHIYHHTIVFTFGWTIVKFYAGGQIVFFGTVNAFVHAIMYSYYLIAALNPGSSDSIWWKKYLTQLQLIQFLLTGLHATVGLLSSDCNYPKILLALGIPQDVFMCIMFVDFYRNSYIVRRHKGVSSKNSNSFISVSPDTNNVPNGGDITLKQD